MADTDRIKRNLAKMIDQGAPESDLDAYLQSEGFKSPEEWRAALKPAGKPVGAAMAINPPPISDAPSLEPGPRTSQMPDAPRPWSDVAVNALTNLPRSLGKVVGDTVHAVTHPVETGNALGAVVRGIETPRQMVKTTLPNGQSVYQPQDVPETPEQTAARTAPANALGDYYAGRYGSVEGFKNALADDPASVLMDASVPLTGAGALPIRGAEIAGKVGAAIDPITQTGNALRLAGKAAEKGSSNVLGMTTGAGKESIRSAGRAGREGGAAAESFAENMRGNVPVTEIVARAKDAVSAMREERNAAYAAGKVDLAKDATVLDFGAINSAVDKASEVGQFRGRSGTAPAVTVEPAAAETVGKMRDLVNAWQALDPAEYHTPVGIDALKRALGNLRDSTGPHTPERVAADRIYKAVREEVASQAPSYSKMMEGYARASEKIDEATRTFSLGERATGDTAARKLLSATRNNVQTNYGERTRLLNELATYDPTLPHAIAGQSLNTLAPRGLVARGGLMANLGAIPFNPMNALMLPAQSPRIVGEAVYLGGRLAGSVEDVANALHISPDNLRRAYGAGYEASRPNNAMVR